MNYIRYNPVKNIYEQFNLQRATWGLFSLIELSEETKKCFKILTYESTWCMDADLFSWGLRNSLM